ncbi:MAG: 1-(5-phosphoribosyl)-5-((5-phosphoribosylamino)methylideneamino)imidazole-4-carboxamide isomerase [Verrucomicrobiaceae bacterium]|nr:1-(5-phosphoribosyl)-5-((5-phosphoribosylamino)methylideneamino)imidazole-4-carboxamide isomerase [Verrucomicrobiaceae bacterium]
MNKKAPPLTSIELHRQSRTLDLSYSNDEKYTLTCEYLRVYSPSAEVRGHGEGQETLQVGKINVAITNIQPVGNYAVQLTFSDGHDTGLYSWEYLYELCTQQSPYWDKYLKRLHDAGAGRDPEVQVVRIGLGSTLQHFTPEKK